jgi:TrmH family RNA methyltransferase
MPLSYSANHDNRLTSAQNPKIKHLKKLISSTSFRKETGQIVLEHEPTLDALLAQERPNDLIHSLYVREDAKHESLQPNYPTYLVSPTLWAHISPLKNSPGRLALLNRPNAPSLESIIGSSQKIVILDRIQDPQNLGAIIRNAVAFHAQGILLLPGCADPYHPLTLRASAGLALSIPILEHTIPTVLPRLSGWTCIGLDPHAKTPLSQLTKAEKYALFLGSEGQGLSSDIPITRYKIPSHPAAESLNVSVASGIALYHLFNLAHSKV